MFPRTFEQAEALYGRAPYKTVSTNCHIGQRKLTLALLEFLTLVRARHRGPLLLVYAGASLVAATVAVELFRDVFVLAFDPNRKATVDNARHELGKDRLDRSLAVLEDLNARDADAAARAFVLRRVVLCTGAAGTYGDDTHAFVAQTAKTLGAQIAFASDVRSGGDGKRTDLIMRDMLNQARWALQLQTPFFQFKFRMPFPDEMQGDTGKRILDEFKRFAEFEALGLALPTRAPKGLKLPYLAGDLLLQVHPRPDTTEMRLTSTRTPSVKWYDLKRIEEVMAAFNQNARTGCMAIHLPADLAEHTARCLVPANSRERCAARAASRGIRSLAGPYDALAEAHIVATVARITNTPALQVADIVASAMRASRERHPRTCRDEDRRATLCKRAPAR